MPRKGEPYSPCNFLRVGCSKWGQLMSINWIEDSSVVVLRMKTPIIGGGCRSSGINEF